MKPKRGLRYVASAFLLCLSAVGSGCSSNRSPENPWPAGARELAVLQRAEHLDGGAREPAVLEHPSGVLFVAAFVYLRSVPSLWKSTDDGATWARVNVGTEAQGAVGNSDVDLAVGPDGTIYFINMLFDNDSSVGRQITVGVSADIGTTWKWTTLSKTRLDDRPWVAVAQDGTAHAVWNDGAGVSHATSRDRGLTWVEGARVYGRGGSSHLAVGPGGKVAVRIPPLSASGFQNDPGVDLIAVSSDGGQSWSEHPAPNQWGSLPQQVLRRWVEPLAWDARGDLYSLWTDTTAVWLGRSHDGGASWTRWVLHTCPEVCFFPYLVARGPGELAATWFSPFPRLVGGKPVFGDLRWRVARITIGERTPVPQVVMSPPLSSEVFTRAPDSTFVNVPGGEYAALTFLRGGDIGVATTIIDPRANRRGFAWWRFHAR